MSQAHPGTSRAARHEPDGVRELLEQVGAVDEEAQLELVYAPSKTQRLSRNELQVFGSTPVDETASAQDIAREAGGLRLPLTIHLLVTLEKQGGLVVRRGGQWQRLDVD